MADGKSNSRDGVVDTFGAGAGIDSEGWVETYAIPGLKIETWGILTM